MEGDLPFLGAPVGVDQVVLGEEVPEGGVVLQDRPLVGGCSPRRDTSTGEPASLGGGCRMVRA